MPEQNAPKLPPEGGAPVSLGAAQKKSAPTEGRHDGMLRLTAGQYLRAKGLRQEHWPGFLEECRQKYPDQRHVVPEWDAIYQRFQDRPVR